MSIEKIQNEIENLETKDVAEKRLKMFKLFEKLLEMRIDDTDTDVLSELSNKDGYMFKLSQDFLLASSTMEKEDKLHKILEHVEKKI